MKIGMLERCVEPCDAHNLCTCCIKKKDDIRISRDQRKTTTSPSHFAVFWMLKTLLGIKDFQNENFPHCFRNFYLLATCTFQV